MFVILHVTTDLNAFHLPLAAWLAKFANEAALVYASPSPDPWNLLCENKKTSTRQYDLDTPRLHVLTHVSPLEVLLQCHWSLAVIFSDNYSYNPSSLVPTILHFGYLLPASFLAWLIPIAPYWTFWTEQWSIQDSATAGQISDQYRSAVSFSTFSHQIHSRRRGYGGVCPPLRLSD